MYDMAIWLAMRDAIALVTPHEDLIMDGVPAPVAALSEVATTAVVSAMSTSTGLLIASSTVPHGLPTAFTVTHAAAASSRWLLCDLASLKSVAPTAGAAKWVSDADDGTVLLFAATTPCHKG